ncbi:MAG: CDP-alcohol phosphatidyltransferase family protein [Candidatus Diapherotrites archaeon]|nr:CDP-alcohol phosphatidyltransferase family protein [Candidatus Diapherotrites archaeon]
MIGKPLRKWAEKNVTNPIGALLAKTGITPNQFTMLSIPVVLAAAYFIYIRDWPMALVLVVVSIIWDNFDGAIARATNRVTKFGSYLDYMIDKVVELTIYTAFALAGYPAESIIAASLNMLNSVAKPAVAIRIPMGNEDWPAIGERSERMLLLMIGMAAAIFYPQIAGYETISVAIWLVALLCLIGTAQRMLFARKLIAGYEKTHKKQMIRT